MPTRAKPTEDKLLGPAFTDIPGKEGYEDVTKRPDWMTYPEEPPTMKMPKKPKGIKEFVTPDYSRRDEFEKLVFKKIGENPFQIDVMAEVNKANEDLPDLFRHIFRGKVIWEDRGRLNKKQIDYWDDIVKQYRSDVYNQVTSDKAQKIEEHKWMMGQFDSKAAEYKAAVGRARTAHEKITKEWKGERKLPKPPKAITPTEKRMTAKDVAGAEEKILRNPDLEAIKGPIDLFNQYAKKPYWYIWKDEIKKAGWLDIDWLAGDEPAGVGKIKLPKVKGKQVYAKDVWDTAQKHGITYEEVLKRIKAIK